MSRLPLRLRLTLVFTLATAAVLGGAGVLVYERVSSDLSGALDVQLRGRALDVSALVRRGGSLDATTGTLVEQGESFAELLSVRGAVVDATAPIRRRLLTPSELRRAGRHELFVNRSSVPGLDEPARLLAVPVVRGSERLVLVVGATRENRAETLRSLRAAFLIGGPLALLLTALAGYMLAGAALRPIEAMRRQAAAISTSSLDERLPVPPAQDEVRRLGETLNEMLARLEDGLARERRFVADAGHELRTPLALLRAELELALSHPRPPAELEQVIRSAGVETERLARLAEDLLLLARTEQGRLQLDAEPTDAIDVLEAVAARFEHRAKLEGRSIDVSVGDPIVVTADRLRLEQALGNLVANALEHGRGSVTLTASARDGTAELHVLDEGGGFPPAFIERAFERFSRADTARAGDGTGLGLAIVDTIARAHRGRAHAANRLGRGADVWIALPL